MFLSSSTIARLLACWSWCFDASMMSRASSGIVAAKGCRNYARDTENPCLPKVLVVRPVADAERSCTYTDIGKT